MLPAEHWVDTGYANAGAMADARAHGVALHGPLKSVTTAQARAGSYGQDAFIVDWDSKRVTCPNGTINTGWREDRSQQGLPVVRAQFSARDCRPCPVVRDCVPNLREKGRAITLRPQQAHRELQQARALQQTEEWKERYKVRAGIHFTRCAQLWPAQIPLPGLGEDQPSAPTHRRRDQPRPYQRPHH
jgi:hypothetical protein